MMTNYLLHHGIQGQKWGVRRGPPYPIEDKALAKGTRLNSVSTVLDSEKYRKSGRWMYTYRADEDWDNKVYKGPFAKFLKLNKGASYIKEHQYETVKDLRLATKDERINEFKLLLADKKYRKILIDDLKEAHKRLVFYNVEDGKWKNIKIDVENLKTKQDLELAYDIFSHAMEASYAFRSTRKYSENISKKYDGMVDDNNVVVYNNAHDPIIIFRAEQVLKTVEHTSVRDIGILSPREINKNFKDVKVELKKKGQNILL